MSERDRYTVTVSRINEGPLDEPFETLTAHTLTVSADGTLSVNGEQHGRSYGAGLWDQVEIKVLANATRT